MSGYLECINNLKKYRKQRSLNNSSVGDETYLRRLFFYWPSCRCCVFVLSTNSTLYCCALRTRNQRKKNKNKKAGKRTENELFF